MQQIDEPRLESDAAYRYQYLADFIGFNEEDAAAIHAAVGQLAPLIPSLVDATYDTLLATDATARHFLPRQSGYEGSLPESLEALSADSAQIQFRKEHLRRYLMQLVGHAYDAKMITYLDMVGKIHTPKAGNQELVVPLVHMNALMGLLADALTNAIIGFEMETETKFHTIRAFNKLLWIQNDLINRHYQVEGGLEG